MSDPDILAALRKYLADSNGRYAPVMDRCGVSESTVRRWIRENRAPRNRVVRQALEKFLAGAQSHG